MDLNQAVSLSEFAISFLTLSLCFLTDCISQAHIGQRVMEVSTSHWKFTHSPLGQYFKVIAQLRRGSIAAVGGIMQPVKVPVAAPVCVECEFWREDDAWIARCPELSLWVQGGGFEDAKRKMEDTLTEHMLALLRFERDVSAA